MNCCQMGNYNIADPIVTSQYKKGRKNTDRKRYMGSKTFVRQECYCLTLKINQISSTITDITNNTILIGLMKTWRK